jgi:leader peptidase (prepilin peptidase)/N-methyltransferase
MMTQRIIGYLVSIPLGILVGAFINLLSDALPVRRAPGVPPCPSCGVPRRWMAWSGILATLLGQRRCPSCQAPLPWRHVIVEVGLVLAYAYLWARYLGDALSELELPITVIYLTIFILIAVIDLEHRLVLNVVILPAIALGILDAILTGRQPTGQALLGGAVGLGIMLAIYGFGAFFAWTVKRSRGEPLKEVVFGMGDVTLATFCGLVVGFPRIALALIITIFAGGAAAAAFMLYRALIRRDYSRFSAIAYGPYIIFGTVVMLLWPNAVSNLLVGSSGGG